MRRISSCGDLATYQPNQSFANQHVNTTQTRIKEIASNLPEIQSNLKKVSSCGDLSAFQPTESLKGQLDAAKERIQGITDRFFCFIQKFSEALSNHICNLKTEEIFGDTSTEKLRIAEDNLSYLSACKDTLDTIANDLNKEIEHLEKEGLLTKNTAFSLQIAHQKYDLATNGLTLLATINEEKRLLLTSCNDQPKMPFSQEFIHQIIDDISKTTMSLEMRLALCIKSCKGQIRNDYFNDFDRFVIDSCYAAESLSCYDRNLRESAKDLDKHTECLKRLGLLTEQIAADLSRARKKHDLARYLFGVLSLINENLKTHPLRTSREKAVSCMAEEVRSHKLKSLRERVSKVEPSEIVEKTSFVAQNSISNVGVQFARINPHLSEDE